MTRDEIVALQTGRELDALVAGKVMGWTHVSNVTWCGYPEDGPVGPNDPEPPKWPARLGAVLVPGYSTDIAAAWEVRDKVLGEVKVGPRGGYRGHEFTLEEHRSAFRRRELSGSSVIASFWNELKHPQYTYRYRAVADTAPLAICRAALLAVMETECP